MPTFATLSYNEASVVNYHSFGVELLKKLGASYEQIPKSNPGNGGTFVISLNISGPNGRVSSGNSKPNQCKISRPSLIKHREILFTPECRK